MWHAMYKLRCVFMELEQGKGRRWRVKGCHLQTEAGQSWVLLRCGLPARVFAEISDRRVKSDTDVKTPSRLTHAIILIVVFL